MTMHYDPLYARAQNGNFLRLREAVRIDVERLALDAMPAIAECIAQRTTD